MVKKIYEVFDDFIFRSPVYPYNFLNKFIKESTVEDVYFYNILENDIVKEALFLASPGLLEELQRLSKGAKKDETYLEELRISLAKYLLRMASRCTPFGLFAGFSLGKFGENTDIELKRIDEYRSHTRFDMNYLVALSQDLIKNEAIKKSIRYFPNSSLNRIRNKIRYVEYKYVKTERTHNIVSVDNSEYLERVLKTAEKGASIKELGESITDEEISYETAEDFVNELIDSQLLISEIEPSITGDEYLHQLLEILNNIPGIEDVINILRSAQKCIEEIDSAKLGISADKYIPLSEMIKPLGTEFKINYLFQTDMYKPCESSTLSEKTAKEILEGIDFLSKLTFEPTETNLSKFIERFEKKYGENEVCILEALDPESGIGFLPSSGGEDSSPLLEKLPVRMYSQTSDRIYWNRTIALLD
ncbi:MAG: lantibiotic dehydratase family protein, partial [Candidatus Delongbacteria bacterium]|nr:lantibiotic dehydratase family protein [Candidatus Delongbacteria bacterium]